MGGAGSLQAVERETYETAWAIDDYAVNAPGERFAPVFTAIVKARCAGFGSVLDAGCGSGKGAVALEKAGFAVTGCDLTDAGLVDEARALPFVEVSLWENLVHRLGFRDWVYCTDVLEHIPPEFTMLVIARLLEVARQGVFLSISFTPDVFGGFVGRPLHQTVHGFDWWRDRLRELGDLTDARDLMIHGLFVLEPRRAR